MNRANRHILLTWVAASSGLLGLAALACSPSRTADDPRQHMPRRPAELSHAHFFDGQRFADGPSVTRACLRCHPRAAEEVMHTQHWTWLGEPELVPGHEGPRRIGKRNLINNFCISIEGNWPKCTVCHAGYGWRDASFDFDNRENVDCLICHDRSGTYAKGLAGLPARGVDLLASARSVGRPRRDNCGWCHFNGGGGDAVKHGDLDGSLSKPVERIDVHMGRYNFQCIDCHRAEKHRIMGKMISVSVRDTVEVRCTDCHRQQPHQDDRLNEHVDALACQACHIPDVARQEATKVVWDWSTAGRDIPVKEPHRYLKIKGSFVYARHLVPEYYWFNGNVSRYLKGDKIDPAAVTVLNQPLGSIGDPRARIWPFKVHRAKQPYDVEYRYLVIPKTYGPGGYWSEFDWNQAARLGSQASGLAYSGKLDFAETAMYWTLSHMVAPGERSLQCTDCHAENGRLDWRALGYDGDPAFIGGRRHERLLDTGRGEMKR